jgi:hypothetical protein
MYFAVLHREQRNRSVEMAGNGHHNSIDVFALLIEHPAEVPVCRRLRVRLGGPLDASVVDVAQRDDVFGHGGANEDLGAAQAGADGRVVQLCR